VEGDIVATGEKNSGFVQKAKIVVVYYYKESSCNPQNYPFGGKNAEYFIDNS
jgi:hypothetical protein